MTSPTGASAATRSNLISRRYSPRLVPGTRRFLSNIHHGRPSFIRNVQRSSEARSTNANSACCGPTRCAALPIVSAKPTTAPIARQHQVIAVVDRHADGAVEIGPAAAARIGGGFVHDDACAQRRRQLHRRCEAGEARADNVDCARHQMIAYWTAIQDSRSPLTDTRVRGGAHPRAIMPCSMTR